VFVSDGVLTMFDGNDVSHGVMVCVSVPAMFDGAIRRERDWGNRNSSWTLRCKSCACPWSPLWISASFSAVTTVNRFEVAARLWRDCAFAHWGAGIGPAKAFDLISKHKSIDEALKHIDTSKYKVPENWVRLDRVILLVGLVDVKVVVV
jgi:hypothetical protein